MTGISRPEPSKSTGAGHPFGFDEIMPKTIAAVDRLMHHAHLCQTQGDSVRLAQATSGKRVVPLA